MNLVTHKLGGQIEMIRAGGPVVRRRLYQFRSTKSARVQKRTIKKRVFHHSLKIPNFGGLKFENFGLRILRCATPCEVPLKRIL